MRGGASKGGAISKLQAVVARATKFGTDTSQGTVQIGGDMELNDFDDLRAFVVQLDKKITKKLDDNLGNIEIRMKGGIEDLHNKVSQPFNEFKTAIIA